MSGKQQKGLEGTKAYRAPLQVKADSETGEVEAVFSTLNVIDHDGDVTLPGAFGEQRVVIEAWNHNLQAPPVGKGVIRETQSEAILEGAFFLGTASGKEHHQVVKALGDQQEWSYTFRILEADWGVFEGEEVRFLKRMEVAGVGPVTRGAGIGTRTVAVKSQDSAAGDGGGSDADGEDGGEADDGKPSGLPERDVELAINLLRAQMEV